MLVDLRFKDPVSEAAYTKSNRIRLTFISVTAVLCSLVHACLVFAFPVVSKDDWISSANGRLLLSLAACCVLVLQLLKYRMGETIEWLDCEFLALMSVFCLAWSILMLPNTLHSFVFVALLITSGIFLPIRSCRSWLLPLGIVIIRVSLTPMSVGDAMFVCFIGAVSQLGFRQHENMLRLLWRESSNIQCANKSEFDIDIESVEACGSQETSPQQKWSPLSSQETQPQQRRSPWSSQELQPQRSMRKSGKEVKDTPDDEWSSEGKKSQNTSKSDKSNHTKKSDNFVSEILSNSTHVSGRITPALVGKMAQAWTVRVCKSPSLDSSCEGKSSQRRRTLSLSSVSSRSKSKGASFAPSLFSESLFTLSDSEGLRTASSCELPFASDERLLAQISSLETEVQELNLSLHVSRYVAALTNTASLRVADIRFNEQRELFQRDIAKERELGEWKARKARLAEKNHFTTKLCELRMKGMVGSRQNHGRCDSRSSTSSSQSSRSQSLRSQSSKVDVEGSWELVEYSRLPEPHLRCLTIKGNRLIDGCGKKCKLHRGETQIMFEGRELKIVGEHLVRVGATGCLRYRRKSDMELSSPKSTTASSSPFR